MVIYISHHVLSCATAITRLCVCRFCLLLTQCTINIGLPLLGIGKTIIYGKESAAFEIFNT